MFTVNDTQYFDLEAIMPFGLGLNREDIMRQVSAVAVAYYRNNLLQLNGTIHVLNELQRNADACEFSSYLDEYLVNPPNETLPAPPPRAALATTHLRSVMPSMPSLTRLCLSIL